MPAWPRPGRSRKVRFADKNEAAGAADAAACAPSSLSGGIGVGHKEVLVTRLRKIMLGRAPAPQPLHYPEIIRRTRQRSRLPADLAEVLRIFVDKEVEDRLT